MKIELLACDLISPGRKNEFERQKFVYKKTFWTSIYIVYI